MFNRANSLLIALVTTTSLREDSLGCDPALDLDHEDAPELLSKYVATRDPADLAKLPLKKGGVLSLFTILQLNMAALRFCRTPPTAEGRVQWFVQVGCHEFTDAKGDVHKASQHGKLTLSADKSFKVASDAWLDFLVGRFGHGALEELAQAIEDKAVARDGALAPFALPPGAALPR